MEMLYLPHRHSQNKVATVDYKFGYVCFCNALRKTVGATDSSKLDQETRYFTVWEDSNNMQFAMNTFHFLN